MNEQNSKNNQLDLTLQLLVRQISLTPEEIVQLRLSHLHLAGKEPNISFTPSGESKPKTMVLNLDTHRLLVSWLVTRPDSVSDYLFPGDNDGALTVDQVNVAVDEMDKQQSNSSSQSTSSQPEQLYSRPIRPLSRPEVGAPPPGFKAHVTRPFKPPSSAPETNKVSLPIPPESSADAPEKNRTSNLDVVTDALQEPTDESTPSTEAESLSATGISSHSVEEPVVSETLSDEWPTEESPVEKDDTVRPSRRVRPHKRPATKSFPESSQLLPVLLSGIGVLGLMACLICFGGGFLMWQFAPDESFLADLVLQPTPTETTTPTPTDTPSPTPTETPLPTPTETPLPTPTDTPLPTETFTPEPTPTETPIPPPTEVLEPTETFTPEPTPTETPLPTPTDAPTSEVEIIPDTPTPEIPTATPTLVRAFDAPVLLEPKNGASFIRGNTILLRWEPVGELLDNEHYAVRLRYRYQGNEEVGGDSIKSDEWTVPLDLVDRVDGPDNYFEWFVIVEQMNGDTAIPISPQSEVRSFTWK